MRDIPVFCTEMGVASLVLKKIPYTKEAYIHIRDCCDVELFLKECCDFCVAAGAERVYATGHTYLEKFNYYTTLVKMQSSNCFGDTTADLSLFPLQEKTAEIWRTIYNKSMLRVPNASYMTVHDMKELLNGGGAYFVHKNGVLVGIGAINGCNIDVVATVVSGMGRNVLGALCNIIPSDIVTLTVADNNLPAVSLYNKLGFLVVEELEKWYKII